MATLTDLTLNGVFTSDTPTPLGAGADADLVVAGSDVELALPPGLFSSVAPPPAPDLETLRASVASTVAEVSVSDVSRQRRRRKQRLVGAQALPQVGAVIDGKYLLDELVGAGGFGVVYRATHLLLHMPVAIKLLQPEMVRRNPRLPTMLCTEARLAARVSHTNVVRVHDASHTPDLTYIVMEYIDGSTLADAIDSKGALPVELAVRIGADVAAGLRASLATGLIHRDIKPSNILLSRAGDAKIVDLGLAQLCVDPIAGARGAHLLVGTPGYMAPELGVAGSMIDHRSDLYSLGVTLYQTVCGRLPFPADDVQACLLRHRQEPVIPPHELRPSIPLAFSRLLMWLLAKQPQQRPLSYDVLSEHLRRIFDLP